MQSYLLPVSLLKGYLSMVILFTVTMILYSSFGKKIELDVTEWLFCGFKGIGYLLLAFLIYKYYAKLDKIPVLDFFTFILAAFEGGHNFVNSIGLIISAILKKFINTYL